MHALIIEDETLITMAIEDALRGCGFTSFDVAVSADEAITAAAREMMTVRSERFEAHGAASHREVTD